MYHAKKWIMRQCLLLGYGQVDLLTKKHTDKTVTFATADMKKGIRGNKLGEGYGKAELIERIEHAVAERKADQEARRIAEEKERAKAEDAAKAEEVRKAKQLEEERKERNSV